MDGSVLSVSMGEFLLLVFPGGVMSLPVLVLLSPVALASSRAPTLSLLPDDRDACTCIVESVSIVVLLVGDLRSYSVVVLSVSAL